MDARVQMTHRQRQALATRRLIVDAATRLFLERGYGSTTIEAIAREAGVAVSTVYAVFGNKRAVLREIRESWHEQTHAREIYEEGSGERDAARRLGLMAHQSRRQWEFGSTMISIYQGAAAVDREAAEELAEALGGRRRMLTRFVREMEEALRPGLDAGRASAVLVALCQPEVYRELVEVSGWSPDEYESWLAGTLRQQLLGTEGSA